MIAGGVYSILSKKEDAHDGSIFCGVYTTTNVSGNPEDRKKEFFVTGGLDSLVKIWRVDNNKLELFHTLDSHGMAVVSISVSPDGHTIASASLDSTVTIWELVAGHKVHNIQTKATDVWIVVFSPDGSQIATCGHTGKVVVYCVEKAKEVAMLDTRGKFAMSVAWSPDGKHIAAGSVDGKVYIFDVAQGKLVHTVDAHADSVRSLAFSPNSKLLATASHDGKVNIYDTASGNLQRSLDIKTWAVSVCFSGDGLRVAIGAADGSVKVVHLAEMTILHAFHEHTDVAWSVQFTSQGDKLISVSKDNSIIVYECPVPNNNDKKK